MTEREITAHIEKAEGLPLTWQWAQALLKPLVL